MDLHTSHDAWNTYTYIYTTVVDMRVYPLKLPHAGMEFKVEPFWGNSDPSPVGLGTVGNKCYHPLDIIWDELEIGLQTCLWGITQAGNYLDCVNQGGKTCHCGRQHSSGWALALPK